MNKKKSANISIYLSYVLRHNPDLINLDMDKHGWVEVAQLIDNVNAAGQHSLSADLLQEIVDTDSKGRYRLIPGHHRPGVKLYALRVYQLLHRYFHSD